MKGVDCDQCIHFRVCQFINNNNLSEKDWEFVHDNFIIKCGKFENAKNDNIQAQSIKAALDLQFQEQLLKKITEKLNGNLPLYLKKVNITEGSITCDVINIILGILV